MNLFGGGKKKPKGPTLAESIQQLREANDILEKREAHLSKQMATALTEARKKSKAKDKRGALFHLKRKKLYEKQIEQIYGKKTNIEIQIMTLEAAAGNTEVLSAMRKGADALKRTVKETDIEKVADVMDDINESMQLADELGEAMSQTIGPQLDEDELNAELEEMENELNDEEMLKAPAVPATRVKPTVAAAAAAEAAEQPKEAEVVTKKTAAKVQVQVAGSSSAGSGSGSSASGSGGKEKENVKETHAKKVLVMAGGGAAPAKKPAAPKPTPAPAAAAAAADDDEAQQLAALQADMGING